MPKENKITKYNKVSKNIPLLFLLFKKQVSR